MHKYKTSPRPYFNESTSFFIFKSFTPSASWVSYFSFFFFFFNLKHLIKPFFFTHLFKFQLTPTSLLPTPLNSTNPYSILSLNSFYFLNKFQFNKINWNLTKHHHFNRFFRKKRLKKNKRSRFAHYSIYMRIKNLLLFLGKISIFIRRALNVELKKFKTLYDSFYLPISLYKRLSRFEMNQNVPNFNKDWMIFSLFKKHIKPFYQASPLMLNTVDTTPFNVSNDGNNFHKKSLNLDFLKLSPFLNYQSPFQVFKKYNVTCENNTFLWNFTLKNLLNFNHSSLFFKFLIINYDSKFLLNSFNFYLKNYYFYNFLPSTNLFITHKFSYTFKKKIIKVFNFKKFTLLITPWQYNTFIRFMEYCTGSKIFVKFFFFLNFVLSEVDKIRCILWFQKLKTFQRSVGNGFFLYESLEIIYIALKIKDPYFLINWISRTLHKINFWKHRAFFHYLKYVFKYFFLELFEELKIKGIKFRLKGKISVTGNARTRKINCYIGKTGTSTYEHKILHSLELIRTFTGVMGLQIWLIF